MELWGDTLPQMGPGTNPSGNLATRPGTRCHQFDKVLLGIVDFVSIDKTSK